MTSVVVVDSGVFAKLFLDEDDSAAVIEFLEFARANGVALVAPTLFTYEILAVAAPSSFGAVAAHELLRDFVNAGFALVEPDDSIIRKAIDICGSGHPKSGFPTFYDSAYHAVALAMGGVFLTSDRKHKAKAEAFGQVALLDEWRSCFAK